MSAVPEPQYDAPWKIALRDRIMKNLDEDLQKSTEAYQRSIASQGTQPVELLFKLQREYHTEQLRLQSDADNMIKREIARIEGGSTWRDPTPAKPASDPTQDLIEERLAMLTLRLKTDYQSDFGHDYAETSSASSHTSPVHRTGYASTDVTSVSGASSPDPYREISLTNAEYNEYQALQHQNRLTREALMRADKKQQQQDEFRRRAEEIMQKKRGARRQPRVEPPEAISASSSTTSTTSASSAVSSAVSEDPAPSEVVFKAENPMSEQDVSNLMTYHDQQWTYMLTQERLQWVDFPWPLLSFSSPRRVEELTLEAVAEYIFAPLHIHRDRKLVKDRLKALIRRWDPIRFDAKYLARISDPDMRDMVKDGGAIVARILTDLLAKWNELQ